jgi:hypothetical protein
VQVFSAVRVGDSVQTGLDAFLGFLPQRATVEAEPRTGDGNGRTGSTAAYRPSARSAT